MKTHKKLKSLMDTIGVTVKEMHDRQTHMFSEKERLSYHGLLKIVNGETHPRHDTLLKICQILEVSLGELISDTEIEDSFLIRRNKRLDSYIYSEDASADIITSPGCGFLTMELTLKPGAKTRTERSPDKKGTRYEKLVYVVSGRLKLYVDDHEYNLIQRDSITFNSSQPHFFQNAFKQKCVCLVTLSPKHY